MAKLTEQEWNTRRKAALAAELPDVASCSLTVDGATAVLPLSLREFSTGSRGYQRAERVTTEHGTFQVNVLVTQVGSGPYKADK
jgi:hypothetical protein